MNIPDQVVQWALAAQQSTGASDLAAALALSTVGPESGFNPRALGDNGTSYGLCQLHTPGGLGDGHSAVELYDPVSNLAIAMREIQRRLNLSGGDPAAALQPWSTRQQDLAGLPDARAALGAAPVGASYPPPAGAGGSPVVWIAAAVVAIVILNS